MPQEIHGPRIEFYCVRHDPQVPLPQPWHWRLVAGNGEIIADGAEGYKTRRNVLRAIARFEVLLLVDLPVMEVQQ